MRIWRIKSDIANKLAWYLVRLQKSNPKKYRLITKIMYQLKIMPGIMYW